VAKGVGCEAATICAKGQLSGCCLCLSFDLLYQSLDSPFSFLFSFIFSLQFFLITTQKEYESATSSQQQILLPSSKQLLKPTILRLLHPQPPRTLCHSPPPKGLTSR
jgi:hypothetical protein